MKLNNNADKVKTTDYSQHKFSFKLRNELFNRIGFNEEKNYKKETPFHKIASSGYTEFLEVDPIYYKGYTINDQDKYGDAPIHIVVEKNAANAIEIINKFIDYSANLSLIGEYNNTCLHLAVKNNNFKLVKFFLNKGLKINDKNVFDNTVLHLAASNSNKDMLDFFIAEGAVLDDANFRVKDIGYSTILHSAVLNNWYDILDLCLENGIDINCKVHKSEYRKNATPLLYATEYNNIKAVNYLLNKGADVNMYETWTGYSPLTRAISKQNIEIFDLLIKNGANVNIPSMNGFPIYDCFLSEFKDESYHFAKAIISNDKYLNPFSVEAKKITLIVEVEIGKKIDDPLYQMTPLHWCAVMGWADLCELLINKGTDVNITDINHYTPIHKAAQNNNYDVAKLLIQKGADPKLKNKYGEDAFDMAKEKSDKEMIQILKSK